MKRYCLFGWTLLAVSLARYMDGGIHRSPLNLGPYNLFFIFAGKIQTPKFLAGKFLGVSGSWKNWQVTNTIRSSGWVMRLSGTTYGILWGAVQCSSPCREIGWWKPACCGGSGSTHKDRSTLLPEGREGSFWNKVGRTAWLWCPYLAAQGRWR